VGVYCQKNFGMTKAQEKWEKQQLFVLNAAAPRPKKMQSGTLLWE
jgi:hypothetical protein